MKQGKNSLIRDISVEQFHAMRQSGAPFTLIDVRNPEEVAISHLGGRVIPMNELLERIDEVPTKGTVIVHCYRGHRSANAIRKLMKLRDFEDIRNLAGGLYAYAKRIDSNITLY